ncbi:phage holin family protein [Nonomuraea phyllanthi]|uniref:Phage holin family protein n=1 Tax=Nonomuraea phyllanthi TaxID=2219224 RepID=A0A5C4WH60_9ACTN|nr:phage holin family protein [Nonomuraea phyllanthi]KAB8193559.1 phage holin family protein [Nonomuraea phyllanthi]QFY12300.1 phage holin family protein [Nonomuraea phyllanthi]
MRFIIRTIAAAVALWVAVQLVPGIEVGTATNSAKYWGVLLIVALIFGLVNAIVKPIVKALGCAIIVLTLGLFLLVINAAMLLLTSWIAGQVDIPFHVDNFYPAAFWGAIIVSVVSWLLGLVIPDGD